MIPRRWHDTAVLVLLAAVANAAAYASPEDRRMDPAEFRRGLQQRGLTKLLELYLEEAPPEDPTEALLLEREVRLAQYADQTRPAEERRAALLEANRLLERLIANHAGDPRVLEWRTQLVRSLLYQQAEPYYRSILYLGGTADDRHRLATVMIQAAALVAELRDDLLTELERLETVSVGEYDRLERSGYIGRIENLEPQLDYLERWVRFYRALSRSAGDSAQAAEFGDVLDDLQTGCSLLDDPHDVTHVQAQSLLLAGMAARRLGRDASATGYLGAAVTTVCHIPDQAERDGLSWVVHLALLETIATHHDSQRFDDAHDTLEEFAQFVDSTSPENFGLRLVVALAEKRIREAESLQAARTGNRPAAERFANMRFESLMKLARSQPAYRDEVYAALYGMLGNDVAPSRLHPFEGCAMLAGLLGDAAELDQRIGVIRAAADPERSAEIERLESRRGEVLDRAIMVAQHFRDSSDRVPAELQPEMAFNLGTAYLRRGRRVEAARTLLGVGRDFPDFPQSALAATAAVQVASEMAEDPSLGNRAEIREIYLDALTVLTEKFAHTDDARYWQFFRAQLLHDLGRHDEAAEAYALVGADHEYGVQAQFLRLRSLAAALREQFAESAETPPEANRRVDQLVMGVEDFLAAADRARRRGVDDALLLDFLAETELFAAEAQLELGRGESVRAFERLVGFETRYPGSNHFLGRVLRVRIVALERLGRLAEAESALPEYIRTDPEHAGSTLQGLFDSIGEDIARLKRRGRATEAQRKSESALLLARQIHGWASAEPSPVGPERKRAIDLQLAQTLLQAGQYEESSRTFAAYLAAEADQNGAEATPDVRAVHGYAESLYELQQYAEALPRFSRVCQLVARSDTLWYEALLRDLQCRTRLGHDPAGIIKVIRQQRFLNDEMGGPELRRQFDALLRRNEGRTE